MVRKSSKMVFSFFCFGFTLIVMFLAAPVSEAKHLPNAGLLDKMPLNCSNKTFCHTEHDALTQSNIDWLLTTKYKLGKDDPETIPRSGPDFTYKSVCSAKNPTYDLIYLIIDKDNRVRKVVQSKTLFTQRIRIEECDELSNTNSSCQQNTIGFDFLVITPDGTDMEFVKNQGGVPVCCSSKGKH